MATLTQTTIRVNLPQEAYDVRIAPDGLDRLGEWISGRSPID